MLSAALRGAIANDAQGACTPAQTSELVRTAGVSTLGAVDGKRVVLAQVEGTCICGNVNCPFYVLRLDPAGKPVLLLSTYAYEVRPVGAGTPLPNLRERSHDSALISDETIDAYQGGRYVAVSTARVRADTGERKPDAVPIKFAFGTSSARLHGTVANGWYDEYQLVASSGQRVTIAGPASLTYSLIRRGAQNAIDMKPGISVALPASGAYLLQIDGPGESRQAYSATITIR